MRAFFRDAVPEIFYELEALSLTEFEKWRKFGIHNPKIPAFSVLFNAKHQTPQAKRPNRKGHDWNHDETERRVAGKKHAGYFTISTGRTGWN